MILGNLTICPQCKRHMYPHAVRENWWQCSVCRTVFYHEPR